jgi:hypothetical protein
MPIARKGKVILVLAAFLIPLIPKHTIAGNKKSKIGKLHYNSSHHNYKSSHHRRDRTGKLDCASRKVAKFDGSKWICAADDNIDMVGELNCLPGEIAKFDGAEWMCAADDNTDTLDGIICISGEIAKFNGSKWECMPDDDTLGILDCDDGEVAKFNGLLDEWECAPVDGGGAAGDCPEGFVVLNDKVCIEYVDKGDEDFSWFDANRTCIINNARLCTVGEWAAACQENIIGSTNPRFFEWTDDMTIFSGGHAYMATVTYDDCTFLASGRATLPTAAFRCCRDR